MAEESGARVAALAKELETKSKRLDFLNGRQRETVQARFEALPQAVESSVELAESFQTESRQPVPRNLGAQPSAGRVASVSTGGKSSAADIAKMSRAEQAAYLQKNY